MPPEADTPLLIDPYAVLPAALALERLESVAWRHPQVGHSSCLVDHPELAKSRGLHLERESPASPTAPNLRGLGIRKALDHGHKILLSSL
jgi:hypothetical protein